jgi:hypothetical protein
MGSATAHLDLIARSQKFNATMKKVGRLMNTIKAKMQGVSRAARRMLLVGGGAIAGLLKLTANQEKAEAKLAHIIKITGENAGFTAEQLKRMAKEQQALTGFGDEELIDSMAKMATFLNITGDQFIRANKLAVDLSVTLNQDLHSSVIQLSKALNDPATGFTALKRAGISFSQEQIKQIKQFSAANDIISAQKVILDELTRELGGTAEAVGDSFHGAMKKAFSVLSDIGEEIGNVFVPVLENLSKLIQENAEEMENWVKQNTEAIRTVTQLAVAAGILLAPLTILAISLNSIVIASGIVVSGLAILYSSIVALLPALATNILLFRTTILVMNPLVLLVAALGIAVTAAAKAWEGYRRGLLEARQETDATNAALNSSIKGFEKVRAARKSLEGARDISDRIDATKRLIAEQKELQKEIGDEAKQRGSAASDEQRNTISGAANRSIAQIQRQIDVSKKSLRELEKSIKGLPDLPSNDKLKKLDEDMGSFLKTVKEDISTHGLEGMDKALALIEQRVGSIGGDRGMLSLIKGLAEFKKQLMAKDDLEEKAAENAKATAEARKDELESIREMIKTEEQLAAEQVKKVNAFERAGDLSAMEARLAREKLAIVKEEVALTGRLEGLRATFSRISQAAGARSSSSSTAQGTAAAKTAAATKDTVKEVEESNTLLGDIKMMIEQALTGAFETVATFGR